MRKIVAALVILVLAVPAFAWNEKGHYVVCRLAWLQMTDQQRAKVTEILKKHPHYTEYLTKSKPEGFTTDEWAFMRAGAWADWVRSGSARSYGHSTWHYINYPVCFPGMGQSEDKHQPPSGQENAVWAMNRCLDKIKNGTDEQKAVYLTWLCHLVGDIHQPLHCAALYSDKYPDGDRGGNAIRIRISSSPTNLHSFWDGLLGRGVTAGEIGKDVEKIQVLMSHKAESTKPDPDLQGHTTPESWAKEGARVARAVAYLDGKLLTGHDDGEGVLQAPAGYAPYCGMFAREQIGKAGKRLAETLQEVIKPKETGAKARFDAIKVGMTIKEAQDVPGPRLVFMMTNGLHSHSCVLWEKKKVWFLPPAAGGIEFYDGHVQKKEWQEVTLENAIWFWWAALSDPSWIRKAVAEPTFVKVLFQSTARQ